MKPQDRFKQAVVATLAKRAANRCSNPDCKAVTSGPAENPSSSVNVGEAAHIYGASPGSARYDAEMAPSERSDITNAIWLCGNCHKMIDDDPDKYPPGLLFEWQRNHEKEVAAVLGRAGAELRRRYENRHLEEFGRLTYAAERIILEKGAHWEYRLTAEVLRHEIAPVMQRWNALKRGLYLKLNYRVPRADSLVWMQTRMQEIEQIVLALTGLLNEEFQIGWGEPGTPGIDTTIVTACRLFREVCEKALEWEESVRFAYVDDAIVEIKELFIGVAGRMLEEVAKFPAYVGEVFGKDPPKGTLRLNLVLDFPEGWDEAIEQALARARPSLIEHSTF